jgi:aspartate aminotransferase, mitochondrial
MLSSITRPLSRRIWLSSCRSLGHWKNFELGPPDPIVGLNEAYAADTSPNKVNVGVGAYRTDEGVPHVLPCVREAEQRLIEKQGNHEYLGIAGDPDYVKVALEFVYGKDSDVLKQGRVAGVQTLSGTGGLRVFGELIKEKGGHKFIYLPNPTWGNHIPIFKNR